jgi:inositol oxygenase
MNEAESDKKNKSAEEFRVYLEKTTVADFYLLNHKYQTYEFTQKMSSECLPVGKMKIDILESIRLMDEIIDSSDPDSERPQIFHALQTGEACRRALPDKDWFHLVGFIHDLGKILAHEKLYGLPQWAVVGDTFPVGCAFDNKVVFSKYFKENEDTKHEIYSTKLGIYKEHCGFDNVTFSWGHDEYMYQVLMNNKHNLPYEALYIIRYHSFYAWHNKGSYDYLTNEKDLEYLPLLKAFQRCDLYSKLDEELVIEELLPYYEELIKKYFPSTILDW